MISKNETILITGAAGFIGFHLSGKLLKQGYKVVGVDNVNDYYDVELKNARLSQLLALPGFTFCRVDIANNTELVRVFEEHRPAIVVNLGAQAGVRYSLEKPFSYGESNLVGFLNILEACRHFKVKHLVYASSSSVYGENKKVPFAVSDPVEKPISLYAATKRANELMAYTYSHLYKLPCTGLRFFTVYGPWGRPDMAYFKFTKSIFEGKPIDVYNNGEMRRDFTYVDDITEGIYRVMQNIPVAANDTAPWRLYNIGNNSPVELGRFIEILENAIGKKAVKNYLPMQPGDVPQTYADIDQLTNDTGFKPVTTLEVGLNEFVKWYRAYYNV